MDVNAFGQALAAALIERTGAKMVYVPEDQQIVQEDGDRKQVVNLGNFYQMHQDGNSIEDVVALIIRLREQENVEITPEEARTHLHLETGRGFEALQRRQGALEALRIAHDRFVTACVELGGAKRRLAEAKVS